MIINVRVTPRARVQKIVADGDTLRVYTNAAPTDGAANAQSFDYASLLESVRASIAANHAQELSAALDDEEAAEALKDLIMKYSTENMAGNPESGFAFIPDYVLQEPGPREAAKDLAFLRLGGEDLVWYYCMKRKSGRKPTQDAKDFWNYVVKTCTKG